MTALRNDAASNGAGTATFEALLRAGFPYEKTLGMRRITWYPIDIAAPLIARKTRGKRNIEALRSPSAPP